MNVPRKSATLRRSAIVIGLFCAATLSLPASAASAQFPGYTLKVKLIGGKQYEALYNEVIPKWEAATGAHVQILSSKSHFELNRELKEDIAAGHIDYCVATNHTSFAPLFTELFRDLKGQFPADFLAHFGQRTLAAATVDGKLELIPRHSDVSELYYVKSLYADAANKKAYQAKYGVALAPPQTWKEFARQAKFFAKPPQRYGTQFAGKDEAMTGRFYEMLVADGGQMFDANWRPTFNSPAGVEALNFFVDLYQSGAVPKGVPNYVWDDLGQGFASGNIALDLDWGGWAGFFNDPKNSKIAGNVGITRAPKGAAGIRTGWSGSHGFSITQRCDNLPAAMSFISALTSFDAQMSEAKSGLMPAREDVQKAALAYFKAKGDHYGEQVFETFAAGMKEDSFTPPKTESWDEVSNAIWPELQKAILGEKSAKQALDDAALKVSAVMKEAGQLK